MGTGVDGDCGLARKVSMHVQDMRKQRRRKEGNIAESTVLTVSSSPWFVHGAPWVPLVTRRAVAAENGILKGELEASEQPDSERTLGLAAWGWLSPKPPAGPLPVALSRWHSQLPAPGVPEVLASFLRPAPLEGGSVPNDSDRVTRPGPACSRVAAAPWRAALRAGAGLCLENPCVGGSFALGASERSMRRV